MVMEADLFIYKNISIWGGTSVVLIYKYLYEWESTQKEQLLSPIIFVLF